MRIDKGDCFIFHQEYHHFHDWHCNEINYNIFNKALVLKIENISDKIKKTVAFYEVEALEMTGGKSWGGELEFGRIIEMGADKESFLNKKLKNYFCEQNRANPHMNNPDFEEYFQVGILFDSGNRVDVLCRFAEVSQN